VSKEKSREQTREDFYRSTAVKQHLKGTGIPKTVGTFRDMVSSGSKLDLGSAEGSKLVETLGGVTFSKHPQQINIMDKSSGKMIVSIPI
jgi:hypothetical protein